MDYVKEDSFIQNTRLTCTEKFKVANVILALQIVPKYTFISTDYLKLAIAPRVGFYWSESNPTYWETDHTSAIVSYETLETKCTGVVLALM